MNYSNILIVYNSQYKNLKTIFSEQKNASFLIKIKSYQQILSNLISTVY